MNLPEVDTFIFFFINQNLQNSFFDIVMPFITKRAYIFFLPFVLWLFLKDKKTALITSVLAIASLLIADWSSQTFKDYFERVRPCNALENVKMLVGCGKSFSMPSNHAANAFAFAMPFYFLFRSKLRYAFLIIAILVSFSRVYVGVHYPSDVVAGACLGTIASLCILYIYQWSSGKFQQKPYSTTLLLSLLVISVFRIYYILNGPLDLSPDEAHYWEWSRRLDLSYYSKGPMIAYLIYLGTFLFGNTVFGVRIMAVVFFALGSIVLYILGKKLYDEKSGLSSAILLQIIPLFSTFGVIFTIDSPFIFFWILSLYFFYKATNYPSLTLPLQRGGQGWGGVFWRLLGLSIGLGLLTKYTMAFFYPCAFLFLLLSRDNRRLLLTKGPYLSFIISLIVFSPVLLWNQEHNWITLKHTAGQAHVAEGIRLSLTSFIEFFGSQIGVITPLLFILMAISICKLKKQRAGDFLFWFSVPVIAFFLLKSLQAKVQANWALHGYITGIIACSVFYLRSLIPPRPPFPHPGGFAEAKEKGKKILIATAVILSATVTSVAHYPSILNLPSDMDPSARLRGWKELGSEVTKIYEEMSRSRPVFIFSDSYQVSSELAFYVKGNPITYCVNLGRRMNQYDLWPGFHHLIHHDAVFVRIGDRNMPHIIASAFDKVEKRVFKAYTKRQAVLKEYSIFLCYDFKGLKEKKTETY
jgi:undecaprenyl-diphosphatase